MTDLQVWLAIVVEVAGPQLTEETFLAMQQELFRVTEALSPDVRVEISHADFEPPYRFTIHHKGLGGADYEEVETSKRDVYEAVLPAILEYFA